MNLNNILFKLRAVSAATPYLNENMPFSQEEELVECSSELTPITNHPGNESRAFLFLGTWIHDVFIDKGISVNLDFDIADPAPFDNTIGGTPARTFIPEGTIIHDMQEFKQWTTMEYLPKPLHKKWACCFTGPNKRLMAKHWLLRTPERLPPGEDKFPVDMTSPNFANNGFFYTGKTACEIRTYLCSLSLSDSSSELLRIRTALQKYLEPLVARKPPDIRFFAPENIQFQTYEDMCQWLGESFINGLNPANFLLAIYEMMAQFFYRRNLKLLMKQIELYMAVIADGRLTGCCEWYGNIKYPVDPTPAPTVRKPLPFDENASPFQYGGHEF